MANTDASKPIRIMGVILMVVLAAILVNEAVQYGWAWTRIALAIRDARTVVAESVRTDPANRDAAATAAQTACSRHDVTLDTYGHTPEATTLGTRVRVQLELSTPARAAFVSGIVGAIMADGTPMTWRQHTPIIKLDYNQQFTVQ